TEGAAAAANPTPDDTTELVDTPQASGSENAGGVQDNPIADVIGSTPAEAPEAGQVEEVLPAPAEAEGAAPEASADEPAAEQAASVADTAAEETAPADEPAAQQAVAAVAAVGEPIPEREPVPAPAPEA